MDSDCKVAYGVKLLPLFFGASLAKAHINLFQTSLNHQQRSHTLIPHVIPHYGV
ncbi:hypothetical protein [Funiculus sociatus]|uniref:hypothetical protein n=1 Tax=Funiculus sociatus TaxID=450527 RepID=UPI00198757BD|nr:hypothetical protein [Trichocoleus sp. FACHB-69]